MNAFSNFMVTWSGMLVAIYLAIAVVSIVVGNEGRAKAFLVFGTAALAVLFVTVMVSL